MSRCIRNRRNTACFIILIGILSHQALVVEASYQDQKSSRSDDNEHGPDANYKFQYAVNEGAGGNDFGHEEERNGHETRGQYRVLLPDGRLQIVTYTADKNGYRAEVTYENRGGNGGESYSAPDPVRNAHPSKMYVPPPQSPSSEQGYSGGSNSYGKRNSGSFVKVRRNDIVGDDTYVPATSESNECQTASYGA